MATEVKARAKFLDRSATQVSVLLPPAQALAGLLAHRWNEQDNGSVACVCGAVFQGGLRTCNLEARRPCEVYAPALLPQHLRLLRHLRVFEIIALESDTEALQHASAILQTQALPRQAQETDLSSGFRPVDGSYLTRSHSNALSIDIQASTYNTPRAVPWWQWWEQQQETSHKAELAGDNFRWFSPESDPNP